MNSRIVGQIGVISLPPVGQRDSARRANGKLYCAQAFAHHRFGLGRDHWTNVMSLVAAGETLLVPTSG
jgi:hypothetical protein